MLNPWGEEGSALVGSWSWGLEPGVEPRCSTWDMGIFTPSPAHLCCLTLAYEQCVADADREQSSPAVLMPGTEDSQERRYLSCVPGDLKTL